jgi:hypothetical protein
MSTDSIVLITAKVFQAFIRSPFFLVLKLMLGIYVIVLLADILMLLILRGFGDVRASLKGAYVPLISPKRMRKKWNNIEAYLESDKSSQYKLAVLEADRVIDKILKSIKLKGDDMIERLDNLHPGQIEEAEGLKDAHRIRNQIVNDPSFQVDRKKAKETIDLYAKFLTENELME